MPSVAKSSLISKTNRTQALVDLPTSIVKRQGFRMGDLTKPQREAVLEILKAALSPQGYEKVLQIVETDEVLKKSIGNPFSGAMNSMFRSSASLPPPSPG